MQDSPRRTGLPFHNTAVLRTPLFVHPAGGKQQAQTWNTANLSLSPCFFYSLRLLPPGRLSVFIYSNDITSRCEAGVSSLPGTPLHAGRRWPSVPAAVTEKKNPLFCGYNRLEKKNTRAQQPDRPLRGWEGGQRTTTPCDTAGPVYIARARARGSEFRLSAYATASGFLAREPVAIDLCRQAGMHADG